MTKISIFQLETLRKGIRVPKELQELMEKLFAIGEENLEECGVELIKKIMFLRDLNDDDICHICKINKFVFQKILENGKVTKVIAGRFTALGYSKESFLTRANNA